MVLQNDGNIKINQNFKKYICKKKLLKENGTKLINAILDFISPAKFWFEENGYYMTMRLTTRSNTMPLMIL